MPDPDCIDWLRRLTVLLPGWRCYRARYLIWTGRHTPPLLPDCCVPTRRCGSFAAGRCTRGLHGFAHHLPLGYRYGLLPAFPARLLPPPRLVTHLHYGSVGPWRFLQRFAVRTLSAYTTYRGDDGASPPHRTHTPARLLLPGYPLPAHPNHHCRSVPTPAPRHASNCPPFATFATCHITTPPQRDSRLP